MKTNPEAHRAKKRRQPLKRILRFFLRYPWLLKFGQWLLKKQPKISARLLGMAELSTPYVPPSALRIRNKTAAPDGVNELVGVISNSPADVMPQLLVDVSVIAYGDSKSGIQRVTRSILQKLIVEPPRGFRVEPVYRAGGEYRYARRFTQNFSKKQGEGLNDDPVAVSAGDMFLGLDLALDMEESDREWLRHQSRRGLKIYFVLHDLLPLFMPDCFLPQNQQIYAQWLEGVTGLADGVICVSRSTAQELGRWLTLHPVERLAPLKIGFFHHGADIESSAHSRGLSKSDDKVLAQLEKQISVLMVGTLEPRKGYTQTLLAFEELWKGGEDVILVIVGKQGWKTEELVKKLRQHPESGRHLFWLDKASDELLLKLYQKASVLLMASEGEGFGLPLIEAARHGRPIIARDLPVFHEVVGDQAFYFKGSGSSDLSEALKNWLELYRQGRHPRSEGVKWLTWEQSARQLKAVIFESKWIATWDAKGGTRDAVNDDL